MNVESLLRNLKLTAAGLLALAGTNIATVPRSVQVASVTYEPQRLFQNPRPDRSISTPAPEGKPPTAPPTASIGTQNLAEFFFQDLMEQLRQRRQEKPWLNPQLLESNRINLLFLGTDKTRERWQGFSGAGEGRADVVMIVSVDPHRLTVNEFSLPRDLFAPELLPYLPQGLPDARINAVTLLPQIDPSLDPLVEATKIVEKASGLPIDATFMTNIDFWQGYTDITDRFYPGIFDATLPDGLAVNIPREVFDPYYPVGYGIKRVRFLPGEQVLTGRSLTEYSRTRVGLDFDRNERQRLVAFAFGKKLLQNIRAELFWGQTQTLDSVMLFLQRQTKDGNLFFDLDPMAVTQTLRDKLVELRSDPLKGILVLSTLAFNSPDLRLLSSRGLSRANGMVVNMEPYQRGYAPFMLILSKSQKQTWDYPDYWKPFQQMVDE